MSRFYSYTRWETWGLRIMRTYKSATYHSAARKLHVKAYKSNIGVFVSELLKALVYLPKLFIQAIVQVDKIPVLMNWLARLENDCKAALQAMELINKTYQGDTTISDLQEKINTKLKDPNTSQADMFKLQSDLSRARVREEVYRSGIEYHSRTISDLVEQIEHVHQLIRDVPSLKDVRNEFKSLISMIKNAAEIIRTGDIGNIVM